MSFISAIKARYQHLEEEAKKLLAPEELQKERVAICNSCEYLFTPTRNCKACGCFVDAKTRIQMAKCPKDKW
jgi:hypothetical protein